MSSDKTIYIDGFALSDDGRTLARVTGPDATDIGKIVFCEGVMPGESAIALLNDDVRKVPQVQIVEITSYNAARSTPFCPAFGRCGGCTVQQLEYTALVEDKVRHVRDCMRRIGGISDEILSDRMSPIIQDEDPFGYRNHMQYHRDYKSVSGGAVRFGLYATRSHDVVLHEKCAIAHPATDFARQAIEQYFDAHPIDAKDKKKIPADLVVRVGTRTHQLAYAIKNGAAKTCHYAGLTEYIQQYLHAHDMSFEVKADDIHEKIGDKTFRISTDSFFQVHTRQAEQLYRRIQSLLPADSTSHTLLDLYCGTGSIGLYLADQVREVVGIERHPSAIKNARDNARINAIDNARFFVQAAEKVNYDDLKISRPLIAVVDPPRKGCDAALIEKLKALAPEHIIYVSCNPATLARDARMLACEGGYDVASITPVDMFPWTTHVECIACIHKIRNKKD